MSESIAVDVLVAGGGVGGMVAAYSAQRAGARVALLGGSGGSSNRISGINTALGYDADDTAEGLVSDMLRAGKGINDPEIVAALCARIGSECTGLVDMGIHFVREGDRLARRRAAGSSADRTIYGLGMVGVDIARRLADELERDQQVPAVRIKGGLLLDLHVVDGRVVGGLAHSPRDGRWLSIEASAVVLATGGGGQLFDSTTNPRGSSGLGYAMALEAGALLSDMEFVSFEPFVTSAPAEHRGRDLPTTVLREGARLLNGLGEEFLDTASAPTKDVICQAMVREVMEGRGTPSGSVYFDLRNMDPEVAGKYTSIGEALRPRGLAIGDALLEVMPTQHYLMGGVKVDRSAMTSVPGLFAVGEAAAGAHGAHRLAGAGALEVIAGGAIAGESAATHAHDERGTTPGKVACDKPQLPGAGLSDEEHELLGQVRQALSTGCGVMRTADSLESSVHVIRGIFERSRTLPERGAVRRSALVALAIAEGALARRESRGDHYRLDHPAQDQSWLGNLHVGLEGGEIAQRFVPAGA